MTRVIGIWNWLRYFSWLGPTQSCAWKKSHSLPSLLMQSFFRYSINMSIVQIPYLLEISMPWKVFTFCLRSFHKPCQIGPIKKKKPSLLLSVRNAFLYSPSTGALSKVLKLFSQSPSILFHSIAFVHFKLLHVNPLYVLI